ncbi:MAG: glycosyltransferase family 39 protein, partial [Alphaproteobacteria bacterium]
MSAKTPRSIRITLFVATLAAAFLRFFRIGVQSFWDDEVATFRAAALSLKQIWSDIPIIDANPPLIYTILHYWRALGENELGLRSLAALLG